MSEPTDAERAAELAWIDEHADNRFQGYQLPKIQLDSTGPAYYYVHPHPYYYNQPECWAQPYYGGYPNSTLGPQPPSNSSDSTDSLYTFLSWGSG